MQTKTTSVHSKTKTKAKPVPTQTTPSQTQKTPVRTSKATRQLAFSFCVFKLSLFTLPHLILIVPFAIGCSYVTHCTMPSYSQVAAAHVAGPTAPATMFPTLPSSRVDVNVTLAGSATALLITPLVSMVALSEAPSSTAPIRAVVGDGLANASGECCALSGPSSPNPISAAVGAVMANNLSGGAARLPLLDPALPDAISIAACVVLANYDFRSLPRAWDWAVRPAFNASTLALLAARVFLVTLPHTADYALVAPKTPLHVLPLAVVRTIRSIIADPDVSLRARPFARAGDESILVTSKPRPTVTLNLSGATWAPAVGRSGGHTNASSANPTSLSLSLHTLSTDDALATSPQSPPPPVPPSPPPPSQVPSPPASVAAVAIAYCTASCLCCWCARSRRRSAIQLE